ncbi:hypothetical protein BGZ80_004642, partial [Entomortierella chlamydospora]
FENKKLVQHHTEEILGHHIWHFPLEHTKPGGKKIVPGSYEKEFEVSLIHPSVSNRSSHVFSSPIAPASSSPTMSTQAAPVVLLPSSSDNPHAKMKYTIRAILRRPFPSIHNIEASQEVWVLHSSLPPPSPPKKISIPRKVLSMSTSDQLAKPSASAGAPAAHDPASAHNTTTPQTKPSQSSTSNQKEPSPSTTSDSIPSLSTPSNVFKSALSMFPSIDLLRPKQPLNNTATTQTTSPPLTTEPTVQEEPNEDGKTSSVESSASDSSTSESSTSESSSSLDYSTSASMGPLSRSPTETSRTNSSSMDEDSMAEDEDSANYTGVWEPFQIPYSCSLPSETVYLGQTVPVSIQFGPTKHGRRRRRESKRRKDRDGKRFGSHHHHHHHRDEDIDEKGQESEAPSYRFVVKKGILKVVEHTLLREVTVVPVLLKNKKSAQALNMAPANNTHNAHQQQRQQQQQQQHKTSQDLSSGQLIIPGIVKNQNQGQIYQEKAYSGSHPDLYDHLQQEPSEDLRVHQHSRSDFDNGFKRFFNPKRHSVDVASKQPPAINPTPIRTPPPTTVQSPTAQGFPPLPPSANGASTRIINSIEAKFKTEVMTVSLTPQLQQHERQYQRHLHNSSQDQAQEQARDQEQEQNQSEEEDQRMTRHKSHRGNVWRTTIWIQIPGPSELATFTSTKHIVKKHTLQLILLCGLVDDSGRSEMDAEAEPSVSSSTDTNIPTRNPSLYGGYSDAENEFNEFETDNGPDPEKDISNIYNHGISPLGNLTKNFTIVTAASSNHFCALESFLYSLSEVFEGLERTEVRPTLVVYNLGGMTEDQLAQLEYLRDNQYIDEYKDFEYENYPDFWDINIARGEYGWKAGIIKEVADKYRGLLLWLDSGNMLALDFLRYLPGYLDRFGFWSPQSSGSFRQYTHPGLPQYYGETVEMYAQETNCNGAAIAFDASSDRIYNGLLREWYTCSTVKECIAPEGSSRSNHRQDQAALTYLAKKMHFVEQCRKFPEHYGVTVHQDKVCRERIRAYKIMKGLDQESDEGEEQEEEEEEEEEEE